MQPTPAFQITNATIRTLDPATPIAENMLIRNGEISWVGSGHRSTQCIDLRGKAILPGFIDSHLHLLRGWSKHHVYADLSGCSSVPDLQTEFRRLDERADPTDAWIFGLGWLERNLAEGRPPTRSDLDAISTTRPIVAYRGCQHACVVNSAAQKVLRIDTASGLLTEQAMDPVRTYEPVSAGLVSLETAIEQACHDLARMGITTAAVDEFSFGVPRERLVEACEALAAAGKTAIRLRPQLRAASPDEVEQYVAFGILPWAGSPMLRYGQVKLVLDGTLGARTAALRTDYHDDPGNRGVLLLSDETVGATVQAAVTAGFDVISHAIGDRAVDQALRTYATVGTGGSRILSVNHCQVTPRPLIDQIARSGVWANVQPAFVHSDRHIAAGRLGPDRVRHSYAWSGLSRGGVRLVGSSDAPVERPDPLFGICRAVTRTDADGVPERGWYPEQALSVDQAVALFTSAAAEYLHEAGRLGVLAPGAAADFVVLSADPFTVPPHEIDQISVEETWVAGRRVWPAEERA